MTTATRNTCKPSEPMIWNVTVEVYDGDCDDFGRPRSAKWSREVCAPTAEQAEAIVRASCHAMDGEIFGVEVEETFQPARTSPRAILTACA